MVKIELGKAYLLRTGDIICVNDYKTDIYGRDSKYNKHSYIALMVGLSKAFIRCGNTYTDDGRYHTEPCTEDAVREATLEELYKAFEVSRGEIDQYNNSDVEQFYKAWKEKNPL